MPFAQRREAGTLAGAARGPAQRRSRISSSPTASRCRCCSPRNAARDLAFTGGPFLESAYFGEGVAFLLRKDDPALKRGLDYALQALWDDGTYARLYLRFFPVSPF